VEDASETNPILEDLVDLNNGVVRFLRSTIRHIVYIQYYIRHLSLSHPPTTTTHQKPKLSTTPLHLSLSKRYLPIWVSLNDSRINNNNNNGCCCSSPSP